MNLEHLMNALLRIEKKLDEVLVAQQATQKVEPGRLPHILQPITQARQSCPLCQSPITYLQAMEDGEEFITRLCGCRILNAVNLEDTKP